MHVWCEATFVKARLMILGVHRSPGTDNELISILSLFFAHQRPHAKEVITVGDLKLADITWASLTSGSRDIKSSSPLLNKHITKNLTQLVKDVTRTEGMSQSIVDLCFVSDNVLECPDTCEVLPEISDYDMVSMSLAIEAFCVPSTQVYTCRTNNQANNVGILNLLIKFLDDFEILSKCGTVCINEL